MILNKDFFEKYKYFMTPIVINNQDYILDGIEIYKIAQKQKLNNIPVVIIENLKIVWLLLTSILLYRSQYMY